MSTLRYECFKNEDAATCNRLVDYYNNDQLKYVKQMLDGSFMGGYGKRRDWVNRGIIPRARNITRSIVDKSSMIFNQPPKLETYTFDKKEIPNPVLDTILYNADWLPFWQNVSSMARLLKSVIVYQQKYIPFGSVTENQIYKYNPFRGESLKQMMTHHGNSEVIMDPTGKFIVEYAYLCELDVEEYDADDVDDWGHHPIQYMVVTPDTIETWVFFNNKDTLIDVQVNPEGFVPAFFVHDTNTPIYGCWNKPGIDLGTFNEIINLHITDTEFAIAWAKAKTLFTNGNFVQPDNPAPLVPAALPGHTEPGAIYDNVQYFQNNGVPSTGGLGSVVQVESNDNSRDPMIKFDGPETDLKALEEVIESMIKNIADDWDVSLNMAGNGTASSGFQLVVEEMDNLNLRAKQIQFYQSAFRVMYQMLQRMYPELPAGQLLIEFAPPSLPVNEKEREEIWVSKIEGGRASVIDYLIEVHNLSKQEAIEKAEEIKLFNTLYGPTSTTAPMPEGEDEAEEGVEVEESNDVETDEVDDAVNGEAEPTGAEPD